MPWRVIFTGLIVLLVAAGFGLLALVLRSEYPWLSALTGVADIGVIVGGMKVALDTTKTANELRKMSFEVEKLKLEIAEKKVAAEKEDARIIVATFDQIEKYSVNRTPPPQTRSFTRKGASIYAASTLLVLITIGFVGFITFRSSSHSASLEGAPSVPLPPESQMSGPPASGRSNAPGAHADLVPDSHEREHLRDDLDELSARVAATNASLESLKAQSRSSGLALRGDISTEQAQMNINLSRAKNSLNKRNYGDAEAFTTRARLSLEKLQTYLDR